MLRAATDPHRSDAAVQGYAESAGEQDSLPGVTSEETASRTR